MNGNVSGSLFLLRAQEKLFEFNVVWNNGDFFVPVRLPFWSGWKVPNHTNLLMNVVIRLLSLFRLLLFFILFVVLFFVTFLYPLSDRNMNFFVVLGSGTLIGLIRVVVLELLGDERLFVNVWAGRSPDCFLEQCLRLDVVGHSVYDVYVLFQVLIILQSMSPPLGRQSVHVSGLCVLTLFVLLFIFAIFLIIVVVRLGNFLLAWFCIRVVIWCHRVYIASVQHLPFGLGLTLYCRYVVLVISPVVGRVVIPPSAVLVYRVPLLLPFPLVIIIVDHHFPVTHWLEMLFVAWRVLHYLFFPSQLYHFRLFSFLLLLFILLLPFDRLWSFVNVTKSLTEQLTV